MSDKTDDPAGTTHQFQNFAAQRPPEAAKQMNVGLIVGVVAVVALVVVVAVAAAMMM